MRAPPPVEETSQEMITADSTGDAERQMLRHTLATLAYRSRKPLLGAPNDFATLRISEHSRTPGEILAHMCDLFDWALCLARGDHIWNDSTPGSWNDDVGRYFNALARFDEYLASNKPLGRTPGNLFQGPVADALTHLGQISLMRRVAGSPVRGESYALAEITIGRVGTEQTPPNREFD